jgi:hypothetical protein
LGLKYTLGEEPNTDSLGHILQRSKNTKQLLPVVSFVSY